MTQKKNGEVKAISWLFLLYFVILFIERAQSLIRSISQYGLFPDTFGGFVNMTAAASLCAAVVLLAFFNGSFWRSLFSSVVPDYPMLTMTSGVILVSGMVHTEFTISGVQFASYGMLIIAMIIRTAQLSAGARSRFSLWYSLIYLTAFSMAIPVVYHSNIAQAKLFHVLEAVVMLLLVFSFTIMLKRLFVGDGEDLLMWLPFIAMVIGDAVLIWMRWPEEINFFVLIFAALSAVLFLVGKPILSKLGKR